MPNVSPIIFPISAVVWTLSGPRLHVLQYIKAVDSSWFLPASLMSSSGRELKKSQQFSPPLPVLLISAKKLPAKIGTNSTSLRNRIGFTAVPHRGGHKQELLPSVQREYLSLPSDKARGH